MKVLILGLVLIALAYSQDIPPGYVLQPDGSYLKTEEEQGEAPEVPPGYVLQPDGTYLLTIEEPGAEPKIPDGYVLQPDGTYLKVEEEEEDVLDEENVVQDEDDPEYTPKFTNDIFTVGKGSGKGTFKVSRADPSNEDDYSVEAVESPENPTPLTTDDKDAPRVYTEGTQGQPGYKNVIGVGKGQKRIYLKMRPDSSKPSGFKFVPQYISGYTKVPGQEVPNATEGDDEEDENDIPDEPDITKKNGYSVICIGKPNRRYVKLTASKKNKPFDFDLQPIKHPDQPNSKPDEDDDEAPEIFLNGQRGTPEYQPVIACGPLDNRRYISVVENPKKPNSFRFMTANPEAQKGEVTTEPNEDDVEYEDVPENPSYRTIRVPGKKVPYQIVSIGPANHRVHFRIVIRSNKPGDVDVSPILDPEHPDSPPSENNEYAPEVVQPGDPSDPNNCPIIATGPRFKRVFHKLIIHKNRVRCVPVRRVRGVNMRRFRYLVKRRRWHPRINRKRVIRKRVIKHHHHPIMFRKKIIKRTVTTRTVTGHKCGFFIGGSCQKTAHRQIIRTAGGGRKLILTHNKVVGRGFHQTRDHLTHNKVVDRGFHANRGYLTHNKVVDRGFHANQGHSTHNKVVDRGFHQTRDHSMHHKGRG